MSPSNVADVVVKSPKTRGADSSLAEIRALAVVDDVGRLLGLVCLKKNGNGYCSDDDIRERAHQARCSRDRNRDRSRPAAPAGLA